LASGEDSRARLEAGDLILQNNIFFGFGAGPTPNEYIAQDFTRTYVTNPVNNNRFDSPQLRGISRIPNKGLDPRPAVGSPALTDAATPPNDGFFKPANYLGAFSDLNWAADWTLLAQIGILTSQGGGEPTKVEERQTSSTRPTDFTLSQNYPNPFNPSTKIDYTVAKTGTVKLAVFNMLGQQVASLVEGVRAVGSYTVTWNASSLPTGMYFYRLEAAGVVQTRKMLLSK
jgi:hypothetical protein